MCSVSTLQKLTLLALPNSQTPPIRIEWHPFSISSSVFSARRASILKCCCPEFAGTQCLRLSLLDALPRCQSQEAVARGSGETMAFFFRHVRLRDRANRETLSSAGCCHHEVSLRESHPPITMADQELSRVNKVVRGICFSANSSNLFTISTCETKDFNSTEMNTCNKYGEGGHPGTSGSVLLCPAQGSRHSQKLSSRATLPGAIGVVGRQKAVPSAKRRFAGFLEKGHGAFGAQQSCDRGICFPWPRLTRRCLNPCRISTSETKDFKPREMSTCKKETGVSTRFIATRHSLDAALPNSVPSSFALRK